MNPSDKTTEEAIPPTYKIKNPYRKKMVYFVSDVPHLLKTTRNCWSHTFGHGRKRQLWVSWLILFLLFAHI